MLDSPAAREIGARIRSARLALDLSQEGLAQRADLHHTHVSRLERGEQNMTVLVLLRIAEALDVTPGSLLDGVDSAPKPKRQRRRS